MTDPISVKRPGEFGRHFIPEGVDLGDWESLKPLLDELESRQIDSVEALEKWLLDNSEFDACLDEEGSRRYVASTCNTESEEAQSRYMAFVTELMPHLRQAGDRINRKYLKYDERKSLDASRYEVYDRDVENSVALFREKNVPLFVEEETLVNEYNKISGAQTVEYRGETLPLPQVGKHQEDPNRGVREETWKLIAERRLQDSDALSDIFDKLIKLRDQIAKNADFKNYRDYKHQAKGRFDYTPDDCMTFHDAVEEVFVPAMRRLDAKRAETMGIDPLLPWDLAVDPLGRPPLRPFEDPKDLIKGTRDIFEGVSPILANDFDVLIDRNLLDLASRKGKAPGGYQMSLQEVRLPFIFMNAAGTNRDVFTLLHEGGHAFHMLAAREEPLTAYRHAPLEFCEVASMGMEMMAMDFLDRIYTQDQASRARRMHLETLLGIFPWIAQIDAFQHWLYTHPEHTREERRAQWLALTERFGNRVDWSGHEEWQGLNWQRQLHLFQVPFYYIEYGIAQVGALQLWLNHRADAVKAIEQYRSALALGGSRPLPELFETCGLRFDFSAETLRPLVEAVESDLDSLPV